MYEPSTTKVVFKVVAVWPQLKIDIQATPTIPDTIGESNLKQSNLSQKERPIVILDVGSFLYLCFTSFSIIFQMHLVEINLNRISRCELLERNLVVLQLVLIGFYGKISFLIRMSFNSKLNCERNTLTIVFIYK